MNAAGPAIFKERENQIVRKGSGAFDMDCNRESLAGAVSQRACVFCGSRVVLYPIADALHLVHGPIGCAAYTWDIRGALSSGPTLHRLSFSTDLQERDIIFGAEEKLYQALTELIDRHHPSAAFVYSTCIVGIIGDDLEAVCKRVAAEKKISVLPVQSEGFKGNKREGYSAACKAMFRLVGSGDTSSISPLSVNILGDFNLAGELWIIRDYLKKMGVETVANITGDGRVADIRRAHGAALNLVQCSGATIELAAMMKESFGVPFKRVSYFGVEDMAQALYDVADFFKEIDPEVVERTRKLVHDELAVLYPELQKYKRDLLGKKAAIYVGGAFKAFSLVKAFRLIGMKVVLVGSQTGTEEDYRELHDITDEGTIIVDDSNPLELSSFLKEKDCDIFVGGVKERPIAYKLGVGFCDHNHERKEPLEGFVGMLNFAKEVHSSVMSPVWRFVPRRRPPLGIEHPEFPPAGEAGWAGGLANSAGGSTVPPREFNTRSNGPPAKPAGNSAGGPTAPPQPDCQVENATAIGGGGAMTITGAATRPAVPPPSPGNSTPGVTARRQSQRATRQAVPPPMEHKAYISTTNACKLCKPLGACLAFRGIEGSVPMLHGSQGCATYMRRYIISHFREPMDIASSSLGEKHAIYGGGPNLKQGLLNVMTKYGAKLIGIATTCLTETIGDDAAMIVKEFRREMQGSGEGVLPELVTVSTPSYSGTHMEGFHAAVRATVEQVSGNENCTHPLNLLPGFLSPEDIRHLREIVDDFRCPSVILPDFSMTMDGPALEDDEKVPSGGTPIADIRGMGGAAATFEFGQTLSGFKTAGKYLDERFGVPLHSMGIPIGLRETDIFFEALEELSGSDRPEKYALERGRLIDAFVDGHKYLFGKRAVVFGEEDLVVGLTSFLAEIGITPVLCASGGTSGKLKTAIERVTSGITQNSPEAREGMDFQQIEELAVELSPDLLIGHSKGYALSKKLGVPLVRVGFPIHDRFGAQRTLHVGYRGTQSLLDRVVNAIIESRQDDSSIGYAYM